jgi:ribosomal protein S18 acetylase RimI-like enzyme
LRGADGHARLLLGVKADNARAIAFYEKQRFRLIDTRRFDVGGTLYDDVVLARDLQPELTR